MHAEAFSGAPPGSTTAPMSVLAYLTAMRPLLEGLEREAEELAAPRPPGRKARPYVWQMVWDLAVVLEESGSQLSCGRSLIEADPRYAAVLDDLAAGRLKQFATSGDPHGA